MTRSGNWLPSHPAASDLNVAQAQIDPYDHLPTPQRFMTRLQWKENDFLHIECVGDALILTKKDSK